MTNYAEFASYFDGRRMKPRSQNAHVGTKEQKYSTDQLSTCITFATFFTEVRISII